MTKHSAPLFESLIEVRWDVPAHGAWQMALDEALLTACAETTFRVYSWAEPQVTFGFFGDYESVAARHPGRRCTRRWTGGGVVEHGPDFTWSVCIPARESFAKLRGEEIYRLLHGALGGALNELGVSSTHAAGGRAADRCFASPVKHDLLEGHEKIAGGALRRSRLGILYQGSVRIDKKLHEPLRSKLIPALSGAFRREELSSALQERAATLEKRRYGCPLWLWRRQSSVGYPA